MGSVKRAPEVVRAACARCPFRSDVPIYLREEFRQQIVDEMIHQQQTIPCHEYVEFAEGEDGEEYASRTGPQCFGSLKALDRVGSSTQLQRIEERLGMRSEGEYERGPDVWDLNVWARIPMGETAETFDLDSLDHVETCNTVGDDCEAPAGYMSAGGGIVVGTVAATNECPECGEMVCDACVRVDGRCGNCAGWDEEEDE
jgi:hypothetical protein